MTRLIAGLFVALVLALPTAVLDAAPAGACSCARFSDADAFARADAVFVGNVIGYRPPARAPAQPVSSVDPAFWTFAVREVYKGEVTRTQEVVSEVSGVSCGLEIPRSGTFLVFAGTRTSGSSPAPDAGQFYAGLCGGTRSLSEGDLEPGLARPHAPAHAAGPAPGTQARLAPVGSSRDARVIWVAGAAVVASLGLGVVILVLRRRPGAPRT